MAKNRPQKPYSYHLRKGRPPTPGLTHCIYDGALLIGGSYFSRPVLRCIKCSARAPLRRSPRAQRIPANKLDRKLRIRGHRLLDPLWKLKSKRYGVPEVVVRERAYRWLAEQLNIPERDAHFGRLTGENLKRAVDILQQLHDRCIPKAH